MRKTLTFNRLSEALTDLTIITSDLHSKSIDWLLNEGNTGI